MLERITTGISGLDEMLGGGIPRGHIISIAGPAGAGKTIISMQLIHANITKGRKSIFISASDHEEAIIDSAKMFGWDFQSHVNSGLLTVKKLKLAEVKEMGISSDFVKELPRVVASSNAEIVVIDSITQFSDLCISDIDQRGRLLNLYEIIKDMGATAVLTAEAAHEGDRTKYGIVEYALDGLILLRRIQSKDMSELMHVLQILKMRWIKHSREIRQYDVTDRGIEVYAKYGVLLGD